MRGSWTNLAPFLYALYSSQNICVSGPSCRPPTRMHPAFRGGVDVLAIPMREGGSMRIPKDVPLSRYIRELIAADQIEKFYFSDDWKELREDVLDRFHYECQRCLERGKYTRAICVHHVNEVRHRPDLALSRYYMDEHGERKPNLLPLCNTCHNEVHDKLGEWQRRDKFQNEEKW